MNMKTESTFFNKYYLVILICCYCTFSFSQEIIWSNYTSTESVKSILVENDIIWIGEIGPSANLVRMNLNDYSFILYNKHNSDLPDNNIYAIAKDQNGIRWLGTPKGLIKFEGNSWETFNPVNSGLPDTFVTSVLIDNDDNKWIGTFRPGSFGVGELGGLAKFDGTSWVVYRMGNSNLPNNNITSIAMESNGTIWVGTVNGLLKINGNQWTAFDIFNSGLLTNDISCIVIDNEDNAWIGTGEGIVKYENGTWTNFNLGAIGSPENYVNSIGYYDNKIFAGNYEGLFLLDGINWINYPTSPDHNIKSISFDQSGNIWIGTNFRLSNLTFASNYDSVYSYNIGNSGLMSNYVKQIAFDESGNKWICGGLGFARFNGNDWLIYNEKNIPLSENDLGMTTIAVEDSNNIWIGTFTGKLLNLINGNIEIYDMTNSPLNGYSITSLLIDSDKNKWIGTAGIGIYKLSGNNWTNYNSSNSLLTNDFINYLFFDKSNTIWVATYEGAFNYINGNWLQYLPGPIGSLGNQIASVAVDSTGIIWLGTYGAGLYKYENSIWTNYDYNNSDLPDNYIYSINIDRYNNKWLSTGVSPDFGGISKFDGINFTNYNRSNSPLLVNTISYIGIDNYNNKWVCTNGGGLSVLNDNLSDIEDTIQSTVSGFTLSNNFPNPFNPTTRIDFSIPNSGLVNLTIFNLLGEKITELISEWKPAGKYSIDFDAHNFASGTYFYLLRSGNNVITKKMLLIK